MTNAVADRIAAAHADTEDLARTGSVGRNWAVVDGVPCHHVPLPYPWATSARVLARPGPLPAAVVTALTGWLGARSPQWTLFVRAVDVPAYEAFTVWERLPALSLSGPVRPVPVAPDLEIGPATSPEEFLAVYGSELAPTVTDDHLASPRLHHLVARRSGKPVGCIRLRLLGDTAHLSAITVSKAVRGQGIGGAITAAAAEIAASYSDLVWLHCNPASRPLYERLGFRHVDDHAHVVPEDSEAARQAKSAK
jgi:ribosomal protein S18 acetylase RimI-like enzyme